jgi:hypothetical protein
MDTSTLPTMLNLLWAVMTLSAAAALVVWDCRHDRWRGRGARARRLGAVLLLGLCLFPSVSSSDDLFSFSLFESHFGRRGATGSVPPESSEGGGATTLIIALNALEHCQSEVIWFFVLVLCAACAIACSQLMFVGRPTVAGCGRAPPLA